MKLSDIDPALRTYLLETIASLLDAGAMSMDQYAATGKSFKEITPPEIFPALADAIKKTSTEDLPPDTKPFMDGLVLIAGQAGADLAAMHSNSPSEGVKKVMKKYLPSFVGLIQKNPAVVQLATQIQYSEESLMAELAITQALLKETMKLSGKISADVKHVPAFTAKLREIATLLRAKK